ncbi:hypothetical protein FQZ97_822870 [compost metagenome]
MKLMAPPRLRLALSLSPSPSVMVAVRLIRSPLASPAGWSGPVLGVWKIARDCTRVTRPSASTLRRKANCPPPTTRPTISAPSLNRRMPLPVAVSRSPLSTPGDFTSRL